MTTSFAAIAESPFKLNYDAERVSAPLDVGITSSTLDRRTASQCTPLQSLIAGAARYLQVNGKQAVAVGSPYIATTLQPLDFAARVRVTGASSHTLYLCASRPMLTILLMRMGATDITTDAMRSVLKGMARAMLSNVGDKEYLAWDPIVLNSRGQRLFSEHDSLLVTPLHWRRFAAQLVMSI